MFLIVEMNNLQQVNLIDTERQRERFLARNIDSLFIRQKRRIIIDNLLLLF